MSIVWPGALSDEAELECYKYFDKNIRALPKDSNEKNRSESRRFSR